MDTTLLVSLTGFAFISAITPGPNNILLMSSGALFGWQRSLPHLGGVLLGFAILMSSAVFGLGSVVAQWPWLVVIVRVFGAAWLAWMSLRYFIAGMHGPQATAASAPAPISRPFRFHCYCKSAGDIGDDCNGWWTIRCRRRNVRGNESIFSIPIVAT